MLEFFYILFGFLTGTWYRWSEIQTIWSVGTWRWKRKKKQPFKLRSWVTSWMRGKYSYQESGTFSWWFHRVTLSFFEDSYHFFRGMEMLFHFIFLMLYIYYGWTMNLLIAGIGFLIMRYFGTEFGRWSIIEDNVGYDIYGKKLEDVSD